MNDPEEMVFYLDDQHPWREWEGLQEQHPLTSREMTLSTMLERHLWNRPKIVVKSFFKWIYEAQVVKKHLNKLKTD